MQKEVVLRFKNASDLLKFKSDFKVSKCELHPVLILKCFLTEEQIHAAIIYGAEIVEQKDIADSKMI